MKKPGYLITFEGIDGCGKSTQLKLAEKLLKKKGTEPLIIREPGSTPLSERLRHILLDKKLNINPLSELLLYVAARAELVKEIIGPALKNGRIILCDRFYDSTTAYQGYGRGLDLKLISKLHKSSVGNFKPHLTFFIDVKYSTSLKRRKGTADRLEKESRLFFNRVRNGFLEIAGNEKRRVKLIDGRPEPKIVFEDIEKWITKLIG